MVSFKLVISAGISFGMLCFYQADSQASRGKGQFVANEYVPSDRCPDASCRSPPRGVWCEPNYNKGEDNGCCAEWKCINGQTIYGIRYKTSKWQSSWTNRDNQDLSSIPSGGGNGNSNFDWDDRDDFFGKWKPDPLFDRYFGAGRHRR